MTITLPILTLSLLVAGTDSSASSPLPPATHLLAQNQAGDQADHAATDPPPEPDATVPAPPVPAAPTSDAPPLPADPDDLGVASPSDIPLDRRPDVAPPVADDPLAAPPPPTAAEMAQGNNGHHPAAIASHCMPVCQTPMCCDTTSHHRHHRLYRRCRVWR